MHVVLITRFDQKSGNTPQITTLLTPRTTTRTAILSAMQSLISKTQPGDIVYIHYSGHGSQIPDSSKPTGLDYALVPCDYKDPSDPSTVTNWEQATNEISGATLGSYLAKISARHPSEIIVSIDSCHSGEPTRGACLKRGKSLREIQQWYVEHTGKSMPIKSRGGHQASFDSNVSKRGFTEGDIHITSPYVVLSACSDDEVASEYDDDGKYLGRFTYFLTQILSRASSGTTYQEISDQVSSAFFQKFGDQTPQIEGSATNFRLFGDSPSANVGIPIYVDPSGKYILRAGKLHGVTSGSTYAIYDPNSSTLDDAHKIAEGVIAPNGVRLATAQIELVKKLRPGLRQSDLGGARAVEINHAFDPRQFTFDGQSLAVLDPAAAQATLTKLSTLRIIGVAGIDSSSGKSADFKLAKDGSRIALVRGDTGSLIAPIDTSKSDDAIADSIFAQVKKQSQYRYALAMVNPPAGTRPILTARIVPAKTPEKGSDGNFVYAGDMHANHSSTTHLTVGEAFTVEVTNCSDTTTYHIAMLDFRSDGTVSPVWPNFDYHGDDNIVPPGKTVRLWYENNIHRTIPFIADSPDPREYLRIIGTDSYVSFQALADRGGERAQDNPFSDLLGPAVDDGVRGFHAYSAPPASWATATVPLVVAP